MTISIKQESKYQHDDTWKWSVWIDGSRAELDQIESVTYLLHPTFTKPVVVRKSRKNNFRLNAAGWGEFTLHLKIQQRSGKTIERAHRLTLEDASSYEPSRRRRIFLSYASPDAPLAGAVREILGGEFDVKQLDPTASSSFGLKGSIEQELRSVDAVVSILSDAHSEWVTYELEQAMRHGLPIIPIVVGAENAPPKGAGLIQWVQIDDPKDSSRLRSELLAAVDSVKLR